MENAWPLLIPEPKHVAVSERAKCLRLDSVPDVPAYQIASMILGDGPPLSLELKFISLDQSALPRGFRKDEGYALRVDEDGVTIAADTKAGRYYGVQTLAQILAQAQGGIPRVTIIDWPTFTTRGIHASYLLIAEFMPLSAPNPDALLDLVVRCAHYKINTLLLDLEALYPHRKHPAIPCKLAFSGEQIAKLRQTCANHHVQIVPLLQCLGHAYHVLRHREYAHLRELAGATQQYCPSNPDARELYLELVAEIREMFPEATHFHMGGDESRRLGLCETCKAKVAKDGVGALYGEHVAKCAEGVLKMGMRPIIWTDMVEHHPDAERFLPADLEMMYWNYDLPHWPRGLALERFVRTGRRTWAASAIRSGQQNHTMYSFTSSMRGTYLLAAEARRTGCDAFVATDWTKAVPHELSWIGRIYAADQAWAGGASWQDFADRFAFLNHGITNSAFVEAYPLLEAKIPYCEDALLHMPDALDRYDLSALTVRERIARYTKQEEREAHVSAMQAGLAAAEKAQHLIAAALEEGRWHRNELEILSLSARTNSHKARLGLAFDQAARLLRYPVPDDQTERLRLAAELDELAKEHDSLRAETLRLLSPGTFRESLEAMLDCKFEPAARNWMKRFASLLRRGETVFGLLGPEEPPGLTEE